MLDELLTAWLRRLGETPCFRIYGKARCEPSWRVVDVFATHRRDADSSWPLWAGTCSTWTAEVIAIGWDFAERVLREQTEAPASREHPVAVAGGRLRDSPRRATAQAPSFASASEVLAHECGHTWQARRLGAAYLPLVGSVTLLREGPYLWNHFENQASEEGLFGGLVNGSVCCALMERLVHR
jgi:hypothetical protein